VGVALSRVGLEILVLGRDRNPVVLVSTIAPILDKLLNKLFSRPVVLEFGEVRVPRSSLDVNCRCPISQQSRKDLPPQTVTPFGRPGSASRGVPS
jgi:hypothetical protein